MVQKTVEEAWSFEAYERLYPYPKVFAIFSGGFLLEVTCGRSISLFGGRANGAVKDSNTIREEQSHESPSPLMSFVRYRQDLLILSFSMIKKRIKFLPGDGLSSLL